MELDNYSVHEMNAIEIKQVDGGLIMLAAFIGFGILLYAALLIGT